MFGNSVSEGHFDADRSYMMPQVMLSLALIGHQLPATLETLIGNAPSSEHYEFGRIADIEVASDGRIVVLDEMSHNVRVFSPQGRLLRVIGEHGQGPEEFMQPVGIELNEDDELIVVDPENSRLSRWTLDGTLMATTNFPIGIMLYPWNGRLDNRGHLHSYLPSGEFGLTIVEYDPHLRPLDSVAPPRSHLTVFFETQTERWGVMRAHVPYSPIPIWRIGPDGDMYHTPGVRFEIIRTSTGEVVIASDHTDVTVSADERRDAVESLSRFVERGGRVDESRIPITKPPISSFHISRDGHFWVAPSLDANAQGTILREFDAAGNELRSIELPRRILAYPQPAFRESTIIAASEDEFGIQSIGVFRID